MGRKKKSGSGFIAVLLLIVIAIGIYFAFFNKPGREAGGRLDTSEREVRFQKEGELAFLRSGTTDTIVTIDIEKAATPEEQELGLMYRDNMEENQGMLFLGDKEEQKGFWMKNTYISLDIIYVNADKEIVSIGKYTRPRSEQTVPSGVPAQYVVEVVAGFCDKYGITEGDLITFR